MTQKCYSRTLAIQSCPAGLTGGKERHRIIEVSSLEPTWWEEKMDSSKFSSHLYRDVVLCALTPYT